MNESIKFSNHTEVANTNEAPKNVAERKTREAVSRIEQELTARLEDIKTDTVIDNTGKEIICACEADTAIAEWQQKSRLVDEMITGGVDKVVVDYYQEKALRVLHDSYRKKLDSLLADVNAKMIGFTDETIGNSVPGIDRVGAKNLKQVA